MKLELTDGLYTYSIVVPKDPEGNYQLQSLESKVSSWPLESVGLEDNDIDGGPGRDFTDNNMQILSSNEISDSRKVWPSYCSSLIVDHYDLWFALILICGLMILMTTLLLTVILFLCLCLVVSLFTLFIYNIAS